MKLTVDGRDVQVGPELEGTADSLITGLKQRGEIPSDHAVLAFEIDGRPLQPWQLESPFVLASESVEEVNINTGNFKSCARGMTDGMSEMVEVLRQRTLEVAREFAGGSPREANDHFSKALDLLQHLLGGIQSIRNICALDDGTSTNAQQKLADGLSAALSAIEESQRRAHYGRLAVQLEHDLVPLFADLAGVIEEMKGELSDGNGE